MGRSGGRSSAGCCVPASVLLGRKRVLGNPASFWTAACAAVPRGRCKGAWIPAYAGMTLWPPHPASLDGWPPSPARGEADCIPAYAGMTRGVGAKEPGLPRTREVDQGAHPKKPGFLLVQEGHSGPRSRPGLRRCLRPGRALPRWGEAKCFFRLNGLYPPEVSATICGVRPTFPAYKL